MVENKTSAKKGKRVYTRQQKRLVFYVLMFALPLLQFLLFYLYVNFNSFVIAFQKKTPILGSIANGYEVTFTGENFQKAFEFFFSAESGKMIWNSVKLLICQIVIVTPLALLFSYYIAKEKPGSSFFRIMLYLPQVISVVVLGLLFQYVVGTVYPKVMEQYFDKEVVGLLLSSSSYEQNFNTALIFTLWFSFGTNVLIYTGAMSGVDQSIVESAHLDGVNSFQEFLFIYVPLIFSTVTTFIITGLAGIFNNQMNLHIFFGNADGNVDVFGYYFYRITAMNIASGGNASGNLMSLNTLAALGLIATAILIPLTLITRKLLNKYGPSVE
jgi:ABC-type sugar transport system permease subunit